MEDCFLHIKYHNEHRITNPSTHEHSINTQEQKVVILMTKILKATLLFVTICVQSLSAFEIGDIPLQDEGRIKPLDTFARNHLLAFYGKRSIKELDMGATDWIINLILNPENGRDQKIFNIRNPEVASSLFLDWTNEHKYSFNQITPGLSEQSSMLEMIDQKDASDRTVYEKQLYEISRNILRFEEISYLKALKFIPPSNNSESGNGFHHLILS